MKQITLFLIFTLGLFAGVIKAPIVSVDNVNNVVTIKVNKIDIGVSGFLVHRLSQRTSSILKSLEVVDYNEATGIATLKMAKFDSLLQNSLPTGNWDVEVGDIAILAYGYTRALLIAPNEEIYYRITKATKQVHWLHPDIFTTILSFNGHPTPLESDFLAMSNATSIGLIFFYLHQKLFTVDAQSMKVINISDAALNQTKVQLPFYSRIYEIDAAWFGEGSDILEEYEPYYCNMLIQNNPSNKEIQRICSMKSNITEEGESSWSIKSIYNNLF
ncbi:MAG: hypothetical protein ACI9TV_000038 [Sulfurimonas sp.]|jgi:hypothetical protein|uniref:plasminogen-binding N-terminal domain-containing protein n=1 Tax=Sulfurimonas sp. TaxID=2022749 RepID=UPI0039E58A04